MNKPKKVTKSGVPNTETIAKVSINFFSTFMFWSAVGTTIISIVAWTLFYCGVIEKLWLIFIFSLLSLNYATMIIRFIVSRKKLSNKLLAKISVIISSVFLYATLMMFIFAMVVPETIVDDSDDIDNCGSPTGSFYRAVNCATPVTFPEPEPEPEPVKPAFETITLSGTGSHSPEKFDLPAGKYKFEYQFSNNQVYSQYGGWQPEIFNAHLHCDNYRGFSYGMPTINNLSLVSDDGSSYFDVSNDDKCYVNINAAAPGATWTFTITETESE